MMNRCFQSGFTLASAIFLLAVLAALGAAMLHLSTLSHTGSAMDIQGSRAYQAAKAGIEWGLYQESINHACTASSSFVPSAPTLSVFTITVTCLPAVNPNTIPNVTVYRITSTACNQPSGGSCPGSAGNVDYIERQMQASFQETP